MQSQSQGSHEPSDAEREALKALMIRTVERARDFSKAVSDLRTNHDLRPQEFMIALIGLSEAAEETWPELWKQALEVWIDLQASRNKQKARTKWE